MSTSKRDESTRQTSRKASQGNQASPENQENDAAADRAGQGASRERKPQEGGPQQVLVVGPDGMAVGDVPSGSRTGSEPGEETDEEQSGDPEAVTEMVEQPAKVMRIGSMIKQLLEEVRAAPLDEASRARLRDIHSSSVRELEQGLAPELIQELERLSLPFTEEGTPSDAELRVAQAQLVGWLEGLFHGIQTALFAQQMAARAQLEQMRRALPPGVLPGGDEGAEQQGPSVTSGPYL